MNEDRTTQTKAKAPMGNDLMFTKEVSEEIRVPEATLRWWRHMGKGPRSFLLGAKRVVYKRADVDAWVEEQYQAGARESA